MSKVREILRLYRFPNFASADEEEAFLKADDEKKLPQRTHFMFLGILTFAAFGVLDPIMGGDAALQMMMIRTVGIAILIIILSQFLRARTYRERDWCVFLFGMIAFTTLLLITLIAERPAADYFPFAFSAIMVFGHGLVVPRFRHMATLCLLAFAGYWSTVSFSQTSFQAIYANAFMMTVTTFAVVVGSFTREKLERQAGISAENLARARLEALSLRDEAMQANHAKSHFLANVSHELRTPMNAIIGFSEVMRTGLFGEIQPSRYAEYVDNIHYSGNLLLSNINDLLDFSRIELNKLGWEEDVFAFQPAIMAAIVTCRAGFVETNIRLESIDRAAPKLFLGDKDRFSQAMINIIGNAIKFAEPGMPIIVSVEVLSTEFLALHIRDRGCGIAAEDLERIREPFGQVGADSYSAKKGGLGLGLAITAEIVRRHDGELLIDSELGVGTTVSILLPTARFRNDVAEVAA